jgi:hypothetical protein
VRVVGEWSGLLQASKVESSPLRLTHQPTCMHTPASMARHILLSLCVLYSFACASALSASPTKPFVGGYVLLNGPNGLEKMALLANASSTLPITRLWVSFVTPTMVYVPGSNTLQTSGLNLSQTGDEGFAALKKSITTLVAAGVDVFLSLGGWDFNCFPYAYTRYR